MSAKILRSIIWDYKKNYGIPFSFWIKRIGTTATHFSLWINGEKEFCSDLLKKIETVIDENNVFNN